MVGAVARLTGLLVPIVIARTFGVSGETDSFFLVYALMMFFTMTVARSLETSLVPFIMERKDDPERIRSFVGRIFAITLLGAPVFGLVGYKAIGPLLRLVSDLPFVGSSSPEVFFVEILPMVLFLVWNSLLIALLNSHGKFVLAASSPAVRSGITLLLVLLLDRSHGIHAVPLGYSLGEGVRFLILLGGGVRYGLRPFALSWGLDAEFTDFLRVTSYQMVGLMIGGIGPFIDRAMATWTEVGSASILEYSEKILLIPILIVTSGVFSVFLPRWADISASGDRARMRSEVARGTLAVVAASVAVTLPLILVSSVLVEVLFGQGIRDPEVLRTVQWTSVVLLVGVPGYLAQQTLVYALLAMKHTRWIMIASVLKTAANVLLNLLLMARWGVRGIAAASGINALLILALLLWVFRRETSLSTS